MARKLAEENELRAAVDEKPGAEEAVRRHLG